MGLGLLQNPSGRRRFWVFPGLSRPSIGPVLGGFFALSGGVNYVGGGAAAVGGGGTPQGCPNPNVNSILEFIHIQP